MNKLNVKYVNTCIKNAVACSKSNGKDVEPLLAGHIKWLYFRLTGVNMNTVQEDYIESKIGSNQAWSTLKCLQKIAKSNGVEDLIK